MATKIVGEHSRSPVKPGDTKVDEEMVCRLKALIRASYPGEFDARPELQLIQGGRSA